MAKIVKPNPFVKEVLETAGKLSILSDPNILKLAFQENIINSSASLLNETSPDDQEFFSFLKNMYNCDDNEQLITRLRNQRKKYFLRFDAQSYKHIIDKYNHGCTASDLYSEIDTLIRSNAHASAIASPIQAPTNKVAGKEIEAQIAGTECNINMQDLLSVLSHNSDLCHESLDALSKAVISWYSNKDGNTNNRFTLIGDSSKANELIETTARALGLETLVIHLPDYSDNHHIDGLVGSEKVFSNCAPGNLAAFAEKNKRGVIILSNPEYSSYDIQNTIVPLLEKNRLFDRYYNQEKNYSSFLIFVITEAGIEAINHNKLDELQFANTICARKHACEKSLSRSFANAVCNKTDKIVIAVKKPHELLNYYSANVQDTIQSVFPIISDLSLSDAVVKSFLYKFCYINDPKAVLHTITNNIKAAIMKLCSKKADNGTLRITVSIDDANCSQEISDMLEAYGSELDNQLLRLFWRRKVLSFDTKLDTYNHVNYTITLKNFRLEQSDCNENTLGEVYIPDNISFDDIIGQGEAKQALSSIVPGNQYTYLFYGPPGTGKTMLAKAYASQYGYPFFALSASELLEQTQGTGEKNLRELFNKAEKYAEHAATVIYIDEIDVIFSKRSNDNKNTAGILCEMLTLLNGFSHCNAPIITIFSTNMMNNIDPALISRCTRCIEFKLPTQTELFDFLKKECIASRGWDVTEEALRIAVTEAHSIDFRKLTNAIRILPKQEKLHDSKELIDAILTAVYGSKTSVSENELIRSAYHEASHGVAAHNLGFSIEKISIQHRGQMSGSVIISDDSISSLTSKNAISRCIVALAGRIAERKKFAADGTNANAADDLTLVNRIIDNILDFGLTEEGIPFIGDGAEKNKARQAIFTRCWKKSEEFVNNNWGQIEDLVKELIRRESIYMKDLDLLFSRMDQHDISQVQNSLAIQNPE